MAEAVEDSCEIEARARNANASVEVGAAESNHDAVLRVIAFARVVSVEQASDVGFPSPCEFRGGFAGDRGGVGVHEIARTIVLGEGAREPSHCALVAGAGEHFIAKRDDANARLCWGGGRSHVRSLRLASMAVAAVEALGRGSDACHDPMALLREWEFPLPLECVL